MSISQYVIGGSAIAVALAVGYAKWTGKSAEVAAGRAEVAIIKAECTTNTAEEINRSALGQLAKLNMDIQKERKARAAAEKKAADRLRENNDLRRKIANVPENPPVPDAIELVIDKLRATIPGAPAAGGADKGGDGGAPATGRDVPADAGPTS